MRPALRRLFLHAVGSDAQASLEHGVWTTRCLHCRARLQIAADGTPLGSATLEHIVPQAWFGRRAASILTAAVGDDADDARNLAIACARCNHDKGNGHDARGPGDARAREVVTMLRATRMARWKEPDPQIDRDRDAVLSDDGD